MKHKDIAAPTDKKKEKVNKPLNLAKEQISAYHPKEDLQQKLAGIEENLTYLTREQKKIKENIINRNPDIKIQEERKDELVNYKDKISKNLTETSQKLENLNQNQKKLVEQQNELTQRIKDIESKINNLGSLREDLQKAGMAISKASPDQNIKALTNLIERLKKTHAELGAHPKEENELADIEERLEYLKTGDRFLKQCENHLDSITQESGLLLKHPNQESIETGSSESAESSHRSLKELFDQNEKITGIEENLGEIKKFCQQADQDLTAKSDQLLEEVFQEIKNIKGQIVNTKIILHFPQENVVNLNVDDHNHLEKNCEELFNIVRELSKNVSKEKFYNPEKMNWQKKLQNLCNQIAETIQSKTIKDNNLYKSLKDEVKRDKILKDIEEKLEKSREYLNDSFTKSLEDFKQKIKDYGDIAEKHKRDISYHNKMIKVIKEKCSQEYETLSNTLLNIKDSLLQVLDTKTQGYKEDLYSSQSELKDIMKEHKSIKNDKNEYEEKIAKLNEELMKAEKEIKTVNEKFKNRLPQEYISLEEKNLLKDINRRIKEANEEKAKIEEKLKSFEQSQQPTEGESSFTDQVMLGTLKSIKETQSREQPSSIKDLKSLSELTKNFTGEKKFAERKSLKGLKNLQERQG